MEQPPGFVAQGDIRRICHLWKSLYGLKQSSRMWFGKFSQVLEEFGMQKGKFDHSVFYSIVVKGAPRLKRRRSAAMAPHLRRGEAPSRRRTENGKGERLP